MNFRISTRLSRIDAFSAQGVSLKYPTTSWSGVRSEDRMVVFAIHARDVVGDDDGFSCLLWAPPQGEFDSPTRRERLTHCRLALQCGEAEGLLAYGDAARIDPNVLLPIRLERHGPEYWARWGSQARLLPALPEMEQALAA